MNIKKSGIFHITTFPVAKTTYTTISRAGQKRTFDELLEKQKDLNREVLGDITRRNDFQRPSVQENCYPAIKAGEIHNTVN
jgi:hypothetical protein